MAYTEVQNLVAEAARAVGGQAVSAANFGGSTQVIAYVRVAEVTGYLKVVIEDSTDGANWFEVDALTISAPGNYAIRAAKPFADTLRVRWSFGNASYSARFAVDLAAL